MARQERRRVSKDAVREAAKNAGSNGFGFLKLPSHVREWKPDKAESYDIDIVPYEVKTDVHPDRRQGIEPGMLWYQFLFKVHHKVGPNEISIVCPTSLELPCPICEKRAELAKNYDENEDAIKAINPQKFVGYSILDPDDSDKIAAFAMSKGKFADCLDEEVKQADDENLNFYDVTEDGKTLRTRFSDATFNSTKYLEATRIDFKPRKEMDEDEILEKSICWDDVIKNSLLSYDEIKRLFLQLPSGDKASGSGKSSGEKAESRQASPRGRDRGSDSERPKADEKKSSGGKDRSEKAKDDEDEKGGDEDEKDDGEFKVGDYVTDGDKVTGEIVSMDEDDATVRDEDDEEHTVDLRDLEAAERPKKKEKAPAKAEKKTLAVGDKVTWDGGKEEGEIVKIHDRTGEVKVKNEDGTSWKKPDEVEPADAPTPKGKTTDEKIDKKVDTGTKGKKKEDDEEDDKPAAKDKKADGKKGVSLDVVCPKKGGRFGKDCDKFDECDSCPHWEDCDKAASRAA